MQYMQQYLIWQWAKSGKSNRNSGQKLKLTKIPHGQIDKHQPLRSSLLLCFNVFAYGLLWHRMAQSVKISYFEVVFCLGQKILSDRQRWDVQSCFEGATCCWITGKKIIDFFPRSLRRKHHVSRMGPKTLNDPTHASLPCSIITATVTIFCLPNVSGSMLVLGGLGRPTWRGAGLRF